jgi:hypothetical protein
LGIIFLLCLFLISIGSLGLKGGDALAVDWGGGDVKAGENYRIHKVPLEPREKFHCPLCGEKGNRLGWIAIGSGDQYWSNVGWIPSMDLYACPKCHLLFWEEAEKLK